MRLSNLPGERETNKRFLRARKATLLLCPQPFRTIWAELTQKAADDLWAAFCRLPHDKRDWKPAETSRTALGLLTECALLNGYTADLIRTHHFADTHLTNYGPDTAALAALETEALGARLQATTAEVAAAIRATPDDAFGLEIVMPWETQTLGKILSYPQWNMTYHLGQINYIASLLGCLE